VILAVAAAAAAAAIAVSGFVHGYLFVCMVM
jgi:hypothetical protein